MKKLSFSRLFSRRKSPYDEEGLDGYDWYEGQTRWPLTRIMEVSFGIISVIVWVIILFRIFTSGDAEYEKMVLLNDAAAEHYPAEVMRIHASTEGQEDGSVLVYYPVYLEKTENLQLTARVRRRALPPGEGELGYTFVLRKSSEEGDLFYNVSYHSMKKNISYNFYRLCFEGVEWDEDAVYTFLVFDEGYASSSSQEPYPSTEARFRFTVYNSDTYVAPTIPSDGVFKRAP
ncbi:MAG: hypothetical protein IKC69_01370 [Clostridia bacterium]|nr:hypothetical protein [Clostridia bacterium]